MHRKSSCSNINAFFVDIDGRKDLEELERIKVKLNPTFIIETKNGYHIYWLLDEPIYKSETTPEEWESTVARWERIEQAIVLELKSDPVVKDITRILRVPDTYYWKKTGDQWTKGLEGVFKIKGVYKQISNTYTLDDVEDAFPTKAIPLTPVELAAMSTADRVKKIADAEKNNFFERVNEEYPIEERDSFQKLISGSPDSLLPGIGRNNSLHITACLMRQAGWSQEKALKQIDKVGWHGMESEPGGAQEIFNTIQSAFSGSYAYSYKNDLISYNMSPVENQKFNRPILK